jgi:hypothetical protein
MQDIETKARNFVASKNLEQKKKIRDSVEIKHIPKFLEIIVILTGDQTLKERIRMTLQDELVMKSLPLRDIDVKNSMYPRLQDW